MFLFHESFELHPTEASQRRKDFKTERKKISILKITQQPRLTKRAAETKRPAVTQSYEPKCRQEQSAGAETRAGIKRTLGFPHKMQISSRT